MTKEPTHLFDDYYFREANPEEYSAFSAENSPLVLTDNIYIRVNEHLSEEQKVILRTLHAPVNAFYAHRIFIMKGEAIIGWHSGNQTAGHTYNMGFTALFKDYQGRGIYSALLPKLLDIYNAKGFLKVTSKHHISNNSVIVPKLKAGFKITGFETDERYGLFVKLTFFLDDFRERAYNFVTGGHRPDEEIKQYL